MKRTLLLSLFLFSCGKGNLVDPKQFTGLGGLGGGSCLSSSQNLNIGEEQIEGTLELVFIDDFNTTADA